ncbi:MAG: hypothetical protein JW870_12325 [Candidatus Delongbacteria bacterium]|nr:hypothetical protein [Candidatus Delongbacteria bacterium]
MDIITNILYNPSVNIKRDLGKDLNYIPTPNSVLVYKELFKQYYKGTHSFTIIGAYGTGKSSFLLALEKELSKQQTYFSGNSELNFDCEFEVVPFIGDYKSIISSFAEGFGLLNEKVFKVSEIISEIENVYMSVKKAGKGLAIYIDEFGKFLEFAAKNNPESELYFIQQLAELANDEEKDILLVTTLHQGFNSYSRELTVSQKQEWDKVRGRLTELTFNEPVEQLLYLAARKLESNQNEIPVTFNNLFDCIENSKSFPLKDYLDIQSARRLFPFDVLSASILTIALQRYGQNQRSLFSFIDSKAYLSIGNFDASKEPYYHLACVYDYLIFHYFSLLSTKYNQDYAQWALIKDSVEYVEGVFKSNLQDALKITKTIGLLQIFAHKGATIDKRFIEIYSKVGLGIKNPLKIIKQLEDYKIILYSNYNQKYKLCGGTDVNIELAIDEAGNLIQKIGNIVDYLNKYYDLPFIIAKEAYYTTGSPRFFSFYLTDEPKEEIPENEIDGFINLIFSEIYTEEDLHDFTSKCQEPVLFGLYKNTREIKKLLFEIEKVKKAIEIHKNDKYAYKEFTSILEHQKNLLNHYILDNLYSNSKEIIWSFKGKEVTIGNQKSFNRVLSRICAEIYHGTPILKNELFNKTKVSSVISSARKNLLEKLINSSEKVDLGYSENEFPPDKTIYITLLKNTGIHTEKQGRLVFSEPSDKSFKPLWDAGIEFIINSKYGRRKLNDLVEIYSSRPFKLKNGLIDFWLPVFLFVNKDQYALYEDSVFIPQLSVETLELISKRPDHYEIKAFDIEGEKLNLFNKYRFFLNQVEEEAPTNESFIETFKPFVIFYKSLGYYNANTKRISKRAIALRNAIAGAKDPENVFFEDFPIAMGYSANELVSNDPNIEDFVLQIKNSLQEINEAYDNLINRVESFILKKVIGKQINFPEYKDVLIKRFDKIKKHLLSTKQKALLQRMKSPLDDRKSWINSLSYAVINKSLENINDEEEPVFYDTLLGQIHELDNLCELSKADIDEANEDIFKIEITSFVKGLEKRLIRLPKQNTKEILILRDEIKKKLKGNNKDLNIALLTKLLQEQLENE